MKTIYLILTITCIANIVVGANAEKTNGISKADNVIYKTLYVGTNKTTTLIFPDPIKHFQVGSWDVKADTVKGDCRIMSLKAEIADFSETNLTVVTVSDKVYSFLLHYSSKPIKLIFTFDTLRIAGNEELNDPTPGSLGSRTSTLEDVKATASELLQTKKRFILGLHGRNKKVGLKLVSIYKRNDVLYFKIDCYNHSDQTFKIDTVHSYIKDRYKNVLDSFQQVHMPPLFILGADKSISPQSHGDLIVALPRFIVPDFKFYAIEFQSKEGSVKVKITNEVLSDARIFSR